MNDKLAVYAGTFDPLTKGHVWMIEQGVKIFDKLVVAIGVNPEKKPLFTVGERLEMLRESVGHLPNLQIGSFTNQFLFNYAKTIGARFILRGIRSGADYEYERTMRHINADINPNITIVFLMPPREIAELSSSVVKGLIGPEGWEEMVQDYVPEPVFEKLRAKYGR